MQNKTIIGIMTGTSIDNLDIVAANFFVDKNKKYNFNLLASDRFPFPLKLQVEIKRAIDDIATTSSISQLHFALSVFFAKCIKKFVENNRLDFRSIDAVAIHGQTVWHNPENKEFAGEETRSTLQLTNASALSVLIEKTVVSDFRSADLILGGQGAPLVPIFDFYFLKSEKNVIALNIGGMANITFIPPNANLQDIIAFDTGCGNVLIDEYVQKYFNIPFDKNGDIARTGKVNQELLKKLLSIDYFHRAPPKSCGREIFNLNLFENTVKELNIESELVSCDAVRTLTELTVITIANAINYCCKGGEVVVKGGGAENLFLMELLKAKLGEEFTVLSSDFKGISSQFYEAIAFAFLGFLTLNGVAGNVPHITGASQSLVLGSISPFQK
ncbi:MAG: anhydro-N-acetylmuramic acid kinase [Ignavibacteria bacterium]|jgi:anhydro-N-acetylmuramic acid kinase|nr:anhydro-N-acetylmuramic acid kinase [Ignavibacteria bacterium]